MADIDLTDELQKLIPLQACDSSLDAMRRELAAIEAGERVAGAASRHEGLVQALQARKSSQVEEEKRRRKAEGERQSKEEETKRLERRLESGSLRTAREYESVEHEIAILKEQIGSLETTELEAMERIEALGANAAELDEARSLAEREVEQLRTADDARSAELRAEVEALAGRRHELASSVEGDVLASYDEARKAGRGQGIGVLEGLRCRACGLELPPIWGQRVRRGRLEHCENCRRILVPSHPRDLS